MMFLCLLLALFAPLAVANEIKPRIINGNAADRSTYPKSVVMIVNRVKTLDCGGTLVSPTLVLTAAHCNNGIIDYVMVGRYNTVNPLEDFETIPIVKEIVHPDFDRGTFDFDVMLLQLEYPPTTVSEYMLINSIGAMPPVGVDLTAMGWGKTQPNGLSDAPILQEVDLPHISNEECGTKETNTESFVGLVKDNMICTFAPDADHCYGDSGGPLLLRSRLDPTNVMQVGIISWGGNNCADGFFPGVGQRTSTSFDWISGVICVIDGDDPSTKIRYSCKPDQTFSPMPSIAPVSPTTSPAPTAYTVNVWIELHMDKFPEDIRWTLIDKNSGIPLAVSDSYKDNTDDIILINVQASPDRTYEFRITDAFGDGFGLDGFYRVSMGGVDLSTAEILFGGNLEDVAVHTFTTPDQTAAPSTTFSPTDIPSEVPSIMPTEKPTLGPTHAPSTVQPTKQPSTEPTSEPSSLPTLTPTVAPSASRSTSMPTKMPTQMPSSVPSPAPTNEPFEIGDSFRSYEDGFDSLITFTIMPFVSPTFRPNQRPTMKPTKNPTLEPTTLPTMTPSDSSCRDIGDSCSSWSQCCSSRCVIGLCARPVTEIPSDAPTSASTNKTSSALSNSPTEILSISPTGTPTGTPTITPSVFPSRAQTEAPSASQTSATPTNAPSQTPSNTPTNKPSSAPSSAPSESPTSAAPTSPPSQIPSEVPTRTVTNEPSPAPSSAPTGTQCADVGGNCQSKEECCSDRCVIGLCAKPASTDRSFFW